MQEVLATFQGGPKNGQALRLRPGAIRVVVYDPGYCKPRPGYCTVRIHDYLVVREGGTVTLLYQGER